MAIEFVVCFAPYVISISTYFRLNSGTTREKRITQFRYAVQLFNTLTRQVEPFQPLDPAGKVVKMYTCGPTVYSFAHIGNFRAYVFEDLLHRHLEARGYEVDRVLNLTDVDDKTIRGSHEARIPLSEFTKKFKIAFFEDLAALRIKPAAHSPAATDSENIAKMIEMIGVLVESGIAYQAEDRSVYFRINRFADYGQLAHLNLEELRPSGRVRSDNYEKESLGDFALWKAWDEEDGNVDGRARGAEVAPAGTSSAARWQLASSVHKSISIAAASTTSSPTMKPRSRNRNPARARNLCATGYTALISSLTAKRCQSRLETFTRFAISSTKDLPVARFDMPSFRSIIGFRSILLLMD